MWLHMVGVHVAVHCGTRRPKSFVNAFNLKRLLAEYGRSGQEATRPTLTVDGKLLVTDVMRSLLEPCAYITFVTLMLFVCRNDYDSVMVELRDAIEKHVEVYPLVLIRGNAASWKRSVYIFNFSQVETTYFFFFV